MTFNDCQDPPPAWTPSEAEHPDVGRTPSSTLPDIPTYNILLLGPTQSGKSTFIECCKQYANPSYVVNRSRIGNGNESHTKDVYVEVVTTTLPIYRLYDLNNGHREFDATQLKDERSFKKFLARDDDLMVRPEEVHGSSLKRFRIFDTPGLNDTDGDDIRNIARIFPVLSKIDKLHLIIITDLHYVPWFTSQKTVFKTYFDLFEDFKGLMTVLHTHTPNYQRLPGINKFFDAKLAERSALFNRIAGRDVPTKRIDCDVDETGPANLCMTWNAIREILEISTIKSPVAKGMSFVRKLPAMVAVDETVYTQYKGKMDSVLKTRQSKSERLAVKIQQLQCDIEEHETYIRDHDTDELGPIFEKRYQEEVGFFGWFQDLFGRAKKEHKMELLHQEFTIDKVSVASQSVEVEEEFGGQGFNFWEVRFKRQQYKSGYYHVVLKVRKRTRDREEIKRRKKELESSKERLADNKQKQSILEGIVEHGATGPPVNCCLCPFEQLLNKIVGYRKILDVTGAQAIPVDLFLELADAGIYREDNIERQAQVLEKHLLRKFGVCV